MLTSPSDPTAPATDNHSLPRVTSTLEIPLPRHARLLPRLPAREDSAQTAARVAERDRLRSDWERALAEEDPSLGALALSLDQVYLRVGPEADHLHLLTRTLAAPTLRPEDRAALQHGLGRLHAFRGRHRAAVAAYSAARASVAEGPPSARFLAACASSHAYSLRALGRIEEAAELAAEASTCPDPDRRAAGELALGMVALTKRRWVDAAAAFARGGTLARLIGAPRLEGIAEANLALTALGAGDLGAAEAAIARAHRCFTAAADRVHLVRLRHIEGDWRRRSGDLVGAEACLRSARAEAAAEGDIDFELGARESLVELALARGDGLGAAAELHALGSRTAGVEDPSWPSRIAALHTRVTAQLGGARHLRIDRALGRVTVDGVEVDLGRRGRLRRVLYALAAADEHSLSVADLLDAGWPGERMSPESGAARVYMAVRRLRELGLQDAIVTRDDGYRLAAHWRVEHVFPECEAM